MNLTVSIHLNIILKRIMVNLKFMFSWGFDSSHYSLYYLLSIDKANQAVRRNLVAYIWYKSTIVQSQMPLSYWPRCSLSIMLFR